MVAVGLALDLLVYDRLLDYQPGWAALPLGALELGIVAALAYALELGAPLDAAVAFFAGAWLLQQVLGHALYPLLRLSYGDDGGELGRPGASAAAALVALFLAAGSVAWATRPPTVTLAAGVHQGPLVLDREQTLQGEDGAVVRGGIVVRAHGVTVRNVTVVGGQFGIEVRDSTRVVLDRVRVVGASLDGINARGSEVHVRDCTVVTRPARGQGIDISFSMHLRMSSVTRCDVSGGQEGIVTHSATATVEDNRVRGTSMRGITLTEMSMAEARRNHVSDASGIGIYCGDMSECELEDNVVVGIRPDPTTDDGLRKGVGIEALYHAHALLDGNVVLDTPIPTLAWADSRLEREER
jgi:nitrous oxidase accessory protein NosD